MFKKYLISIVIYWTLTMLFLRNLMQLSQLPCELETGTAPIYRWENYTEWFSKLSKFPEAVSDAEFTSLTTMLPRF